MCIVMLNSLKQARAAFSLLSPQDIRDRSAQTVRFGLVALSSAGYEAMEQFLVATGAGTPQVFRAGDRDSPHDVDFVLYDRGLENPKGTYSFYADDPERTIREILRGNEDLHLPLARQFPVFRPQVLDRIIHTIARENALFAIATALPDVVPNLMELPWALGEWASDTAFLTVNQVRMAFMIAAACDREVGLQHQKTEALTIGASAFGWRALARELVGKIPLGGGLIPKGAIAYAGTYVAGKGLERYYHANRHLTRGEKKGVYESALERGKALLQEVVR